MYRRMIGYNDSDESRDPLAPAQLIAIQHPRQPVLPLPPAAS